MYGNFSLPNVQNLNQITGNFNSLLMDKVFVVCNELKEISQNSKADFESLKSNITESERVINQKHEKEINTHIFENYVFISNNKYCVHIEEGDRRYFPFMFSDAAKGDSEYFKNVRKDSDPELLFNYFMHRDISNFNPRNLPDNELKEDIIKHQSLNINRFLEQCYTEEQAITYENYLEFCEEQGEKN